ncbi:MAG: M24 family metallopeptidase [Bacillota bacterium]
MITPGDTTTIMPLRDRAGMVNRWLGERIERILPRLMEEEGIDAWVVAGREYNEDPVLWTLLPRPMLSARRRTILLFFLREPGKVEAISICRYRMGSVYADVWNPDLEDGWQCAANIIEEMDPDRIGINVSRLHGLADGMSASELDMLRGVLPTHLGDRLVSAERLAIRWLETRSPSELTAYPKIASVATRMMEIALSADVIHPGLSTTEDVVWWLRERIHGAGLLAWFHPTVTIQARDLDWDDTSREIIMPGDLLHCDMGLKYLGLCTDNQRHAYVPRPGEAGIPRELQELMDSANRLQDIVTSEFSPGRTGNQILYSALARAKIEGIEGSIYSHPLGYHGHAAGPAIGMWDSQEGVVGTGELPLHADTCYALELNARGSLRCFGDRGVRIALEEMISFDGKRVEYLSGRQSQPYIVS